MPQPKQPGNALPMELVANIVFKQAVEIEILTSRIAQFENSLTDANARLEELLEKGKKHASNSK